VTVGQERGIGGRNQEYTLCGLGDGVIATQSIRMNDLSATLILE
jgi:hypothetical protein